MRTEYRITLEANQLPEPLYFKDSIMVRVGVWGDGMNDSFSVMGDKERMDEIQGAIAERLDELMREMGNRMIDELDKIN